MDSRENIKTANLKSNDYYVLLSKVGGSSLSKEEVAQVVSLADYRLIKVLLANTNITLSNEALEDILDWGIEQNAPDVIGTLLGRADLSGKLLRKITNLLILEYHKEDSTFLSRQYIASLTSELIQKQSLTPDLITKLINDFPENFVYEALLVSQYLSDQQGLKIVKNYSRPIARHLTDLFFVKAHSSKVYKELYERFIKEVVGVDRNECLTKIIHASVLDLYDCIYLYGLEEKEFSVNDHTSRNRRNELRLMIEADKEFHDAITKFGASFLKMDFEDHFSRMLATYKYIHKKDNSGFSF